MLRPRASGPASGLYYRGAYAALDFASRIYELDDVSYTAGGLTTVSGFTFTGASLRTMFDSTGAMTYGPNNLCLQSQTFDNAAWTAQRASVSSDATTAPNGTLTADKLIEDATASNTHRAFQTITTSVAPYVWSIYAKADTRTWVYLRLDRLGPTTPAAWFNLSTGTVGTVNTGLTASIQPAGNGWYRCAVAVDTADAVGNSALVGLATADGVSSYSGDGVSGLYLWGAQLEAVTYRTTPAAYMPTTSADYYGPRLVYDPVTLASLGILAEEARTNLCLQSQDFNTTWTKDDTTVTVDTTTSPDGTANADKLVETATTTIHRVHQSITISNATVYTYSVYVKAAERTWALFEVISGATDVYCYVNLSTGALGSTNTTPTVTSVGNGWYRVVITFTSATTTVSCQNFMSTGNGTASYTGDGTSGLYLWQAQLEAGTGASSAIVTTSAAVTRAADDATLTVSIAAGTMVSEAYGSINAGLTKVATHVSLSNVDDSTAWVIFGQTNMAGAMTAYRRAAGASVNTGTGSTFAAGARTKMAMRFGSPSGDAVSVNGATPIAIAAAAAPLVVTQLRIGRWATDPGYLNNAVARVRLYYPLLPDSSLQSLATL